MRKQFAVGILSALGLFAATDSVNASVIFDLNCNIGDATSPCTSISPLSWGTIKIDDNAANANKVDILIDLNSGTDPYKILELYLNTSVTPGTALWSVTKGDVAYSSNAYGSPSALTIFDLNFDGYTGNENRDPLSLTLGLSGVDLNPSDFDLAAAVGSVQLYAEVHIGVCGPAGTCTPGTSGNNSIKVGSLKDGGTPPTGNAPEPGSLALLGLGLLGLAAARRKSAAV